MDMLQGDLYKKILWFTLPIALSSIIQQLFNFADIAIIGLFDSDKALAAVGTNGEIVALIISISAGLSLGTNVVIANIIGKKGNGISECIHTSILFSLILGLAVAILGQFITKPLLILIQTPESILKLAQNYLSLYLLSFPFLLLFDFGAAILRARGNSKYPFKVLVFSGFINVVLNYIFVVIFNLSVNGVAIASVIATAIAAFFVVLRLKLDDSEFNFSFSKLKINAKVLIKILKVGIPSATQGAVFGIANIFVQSAINTFGENAIAGSTIAMNFEYFVFYIITAFGLSATTFTCQNFSAHKLLRCRKILLLCLLYSVIFSLIFILPIAIAPDFFSQMFTHDLLVIDNSRLRIRTILMFESIYCFYEIFSGFIRGCGYSTMPALINIAGTCVFRIFWIYQIFPSSPKLENLYVMFPISWILTALLIGIGYLMVKRRHHL